MKNTPTDKTRHQKRRHDKTGFEGGSYSSVGPGGSRQPLYAHRDWWTEQKTETTTPKSEESGGVRGSYAPTSGGGRLGCLRPSKAKGGWCCRPVRLSHCYWWVWSPRIHRRRKWRGCWFLEGCGRKLGGEPSLAFGGSLQLCCCCCSGTDCLENRKEGLKVKLEAQINNIHTISALEYVTDMREIKNLWSLLLWEGSSCRNLLVVQSMSGTERGPCVREPSPSAPGGISASLPQFLSSLLGSPASGRLLHNNYLTVRFLLR